ncbi:TPA: hypothetical protein U1369_001008 [Streptococcus suis]|nr:hypothetical protein [Streptococcus suis]HEM5291342.1 hypothetical protein [Streptococcus suis]HEM5295123.1 hypothetical protein [Streptococcus suis]HEM5308389.1 hypothetical protein [Streptococcus suis]HEP1843408.1 hypothetical protein [Streptococcus suis]
MPEVLYLIFVPLLTILITAPLFFLAVGPLKTNLSAILATTVMAIYGFSPILFGIIVGAFWQLIVIFGLHYAFIPVLINNLTTKGQDPINAIFNITMFAPVGTAVRFADL